MTARASRRLWPLFGGNLPQAGDGRSVGRMAGRPRHATRRWRRPVGGLIFTMDSDDEIAPSCLTQAQNRSRSTPGGGLRLLPRGAGGRAPGRGGLGDQSLRTAVLLPTLAVSAFAQGVVGGTGRPGRGHAPAVSKIGSSCCAWPKTGRLGCGGARGTWCAITCLQTGTIPAMPCAFWLRISATCGRSTRRSTVGPACLRLWWVWRKRPSRRPSDSLLSRYDWHRVLLPGSLYTGSHAPALALAMVLGRRGGSRHDPRQRRAASGTRTVSGANGWGDPRPGPRTLPRQGWCHNRADRHHVRDPALVELLPGAADTIATRPMQSWCCGGVLVTNQSGIGRGYFTWHGLRGGTRRNWMGLLAAKRRRARPGSGLSLSP